MSKKVELSAEERAEFVLRMLRKEEPAVQIARRAGIAEATLYRWRDEFIKAGRQALNGSESLVGKETARLQGQVAEREQVIGELQRTLGQLSLSGELRSMISEAIETAEPPARLNRVLRALGVAVSMWYGKRREEPKKPGRKPQPIPETLAAQIRALAERYPRWGYKRIAAVALAWPVYATKQIEVLAVEEGNDWLIITVITRYF